MHKRGVKVLPQGLEPLHSLQPIERNFALGEKIYLFSVVREDEYFVLRAPKAINGERLATQNIAVLNKGDAALLSDSAHFCTFEAYSTFSEWTLISNESVAIEKNTFVEVDLILYGPRRYLQDIGKILDDKKVFLQEPDYRDASLDYINPHLLDLSNVLPGPQNNLEHARSSFMQLDIDAQSEGVCEVATPQALLKERISTAFKNMTRAQNLKRITADIRVRTSLKQYVRRFLFEIKITCSLDIKKRLWIS